MLNNIINTTILTVHSCLPVIITALALLGFIWLNTIVLLAMVRLLAVAYQGVLKHWTPKGWYHSMAILISDLPNLRAECWMKSHVAKLGFLLAAIKEKSPHLYGLVLEETNRQILAANKKREAEKQGRVKPAGGF